jgi:hypothetical protein
VAEIFFKVVCWIQCLPSVTSETRFLPKASLCLLVVEEETAKILPWPLTGTESESKYDESKVASFRRAVPSFFSSFANDCTGLQSIDQDVLVAEFYNYQSLYTYSSLGPTVSVHPSIDRLERPRVDPFDQKRRLV